VDVGGPFPATLPALAFENATRRNRPNLVVGSLVYARCESAPRDAEPLLSCTDAGGKAAAFGPLTAGLPFALQTRAARALLARPPPRALAALGAALSFELVVGVNGRCWVHAAAVQDTVLVANALQQAADMVPEQALALVQALLAQRER
jgi:exosome complex component RRP40